MTLGNMKTIKLKNPLQRQVLAILDKGKHVEVEIKEIQSTVMLSTSGLTMKGIKEGLEI